MPTTPPIDPSVAQIDNLWIPLADGTRLAARVWMPEDAPVSPVPAVLEYLPYRKSDCTTLDDLGRHPYFAAHGYAAVRVDLRGTGDSEGLLRGEYLPQEQDDALEVLAWLERQPWCTGAVGMIGYSWGGFNGLQIAARRPPQLRAVITVASTDDRYLDDCHYMGGCLLGSDMLKWAASMLCYALQPPDPRFTSERWRQMWSERLEHAPELARDWIAHQSRDGFWKHGSVAEDYGAIECPVLVVGGWADAYTNAVPRLLAHLQVPRLGLIGPWGHMMPYEGVPGPAIDFLREAVRWWDRWLKGIENGVMREPLLRVWIQDHVTPAMFYAERPGRWSGMGAWPPSEAQTVHFALTGEGGLVAGAGGATPAAVESVDSDTLGRTDAPSAAPTVSITGRQECGESAGVWCANGYPDEIAGDQRPDDERSLCFATRPLRDPLEVLGFPVVRLRMSADRPEALVAARLEDVAPDGGSLLVSWGMLNLTHRDGHEDPQPLEPGRVYDIAFETRVCGHRFPAGHRLRLAVSPTYWPHAWPSPRPATLTISMDGVSVLELPHVRRQADDDLDRAVALPSAVELPPESREARHGERSRRVRVDSKTGLHEIVDHEVHRRVVPDTGAHYTDDNYDVYKIVEGDPLSARVRSVRETGSVGGAATWRVRVTAEMTCDAECFFVREEYSAYHGDAEVFARTRSHTIPRIAV